MTEPSTMHSTTRFGDDAVGMEDPFVSTPVGAITQRENHRYSSFDSQLLTLNSSSPAQLRRALEAHLAETDRRLQETSKLGTALVQQQRELSDRLKEVEQQQEEGDIGPDLRQKLAELEKEYNDIGRESARASIGPKSRLLAPEDANSTPSLESRTPASPSIFSSQASNSPSKISVPSRRQRNQPSSRVHDIEFATEISTSLLAQVRQLQALLAERDETLKEINLEKSRLELEAEGFSQRLRALDESEQRYKDENWSLETQTHELISAAKEASARETRLSNSLNVATLEKNNLQRELDELNQANVKLSDEHIAAQKAHDSEVHILRRNLDNGDTERNALQKKVDELTGQNQELAKAIAANLRQQESEPLQDAKRENDDDDASDSTPENSPPPSPNKATPRHGHLEAETIKSSLHHAHRMIQNLKNNIHREKTEKIELKRMLQDARDELEQRRNEPVGPGSANKRQKTKADAFKKPPRPEMLGAGRRRHIEIEEQDWEDEAFESSPTRQPQIRQPAFSPYRRNPVESANVSDAYQTANETEDAFETANERDTTTESEAFQTGVESFAGESSDELTETESRSGLNGTAGGNRNTKLSTAKPGDRTSFMSTASTSADEYDFSNIQTPVQNQSARSRHKLQRNRRSRQFDEDPISPESGNISAGASPASPKPLTQGRSLFAELGELGGSDGEFGTPRSKSPSGASTPVHSRKPGLQEPFEAASIAKNITMVDSSMMTDPLPTPEPWQSQAATTQTSTYQVAHMGTSMDLDEASTPDTVEMVDSATQSIVEELPSIAQSETVVMFDVAPQVDTSKSLPLAIPSAPLELEASPILFEGTTPVRPVSNLHLDVSAITSDGTEPTAPVMKSPESTVSLIESVSTAPIAPVVKSPKSTVSSIESVGTAPIAPVEVVHTAQSTLDLKTSSISSVDTAPIAPVSPIAPITVVPLVSPESNMNLAVSSIKSVDTAPIAPAVTAPLASESALELEASSISSVDTAPIAPVFVAQPNPAELEISSMEFADTAPIAPVLPSSEALDQAPELAFSFGQSVETAPIAPTILMPEPTDLDISSIQSVQTMPLTPLVHAEPAAPFEFSSVYAQETIPVKPRSIPMVLPTDNSSAHVNGITQTEQPQRPTTALRSENTDTERNLMGSTSAGEDEPPQSLPPPAIFSENAAQTILTSVQIDRLLMDRSIRQQTPAPTAPLSPNSSPLATPKATRPQPSSQNSAIKDGSLAPHATKRPGSSSSRQSSSIRPPLPHDHKQTIAAASQGLSGEGSPNLMGPPLAPASAYRTNIQSRPRTPNDNGNRNGTPATKFRRPSMTSRRSSMSSFASELDDRFNISRGDYGFEPGTDPRMIQAITQTMIGEFLWKYTRKAGRPEMSNTRHRRYFWVHPYTRTLYWSVQDPQTAGRSQLKAKSVAIEAVRVISDDNPYPPGLHRKSLEIITPGRTVRFTASTSQRHETWFNALSYLLLRTTENGTDGQGNNTSPEVVNDFGSMFGRTSRQSARSVSSRNSRTTRAISKQYMDPPTMQRPMTPNQVSPTLSARADQVKHGSVSKFGNMLKASSMRGTFSSRRSRYGSARGSIDGTSAASHDSAEDLRRIIELQDREADRLENVRACCDGKHDVGSLSRTSRYSSRISHHSHTHG